MAWVSRDICWITNEKRPMKLEDIRGEYNFAQKFLESSQENK